MTPPAGARVLRVMSRRKSGRSSSSGKLTEEKEDEQCLREHTLKVREEEVARKEKSLQDKSAEGIGMEILTLKDQVMPQLKEQELHERKLSLREEEIARREKSLKRYIWEVEKRWKNSQSKFAT